MATPRTTPTIRAKLDRLPKMPPFRPIPPSIDHEKYASKPLESLRRAIGYPSDSAKYDRTIPLLEAALTCIETIVRRKEPLAELAAFAWCVSRDPRMPRGMHVFANESIRLSRERIRRNQRALRTAHEERTRWNEDLKNRYARALAAGYGDSNAWRDGTAREMKDNVLLYRSECEYMRRDPIEWVEGYGGRDFANAIKLVLVKERIENDRRRAIAKGLSAARGRSGRSLPNDVKRNVMKRVRG